MSNNILYKVAWYDNEAASYDTRSIHRILDTKNQAKSLIDTLLKSKRYTQISVKQVSCTWDKMGCPVYGEI